ncbi:MAG: hypothetical protein IAF58_15775 [Leptolyngbya sp.]|nr:hypothetical protein [Candidatus Melainabacteria bacterium]
MFAGWRLENKGLDDWLSQRLGEKVGGLTTKLIVGVADILLAPVDLFQRLFYSPNRRLDRAGTSAGDDEKRTHIVQSYLTNCTEILYRSSDEIAKFEGRSNDESTQTNFDALTQSASGIHSMPEVITQTFDRMQARADKRSLLVRPFRGDLAVKDFGATASGTYVNFNELHKWHQSTANAQAKKTGSFAQLKPDVNPEGLQQFLKSTE